MSVVIRDFEQKFRQNALGEMAVMCRRFRAGTDVFLREEVHVAIIYRNNEGRGVVQFLPGITGWEAFFVDSATDVVERLQRDFIPQESLFGTTKWEHVDWNLNAGSASYDRLCCSYGDIAEILSFSKALLTPS